MSNKGVVITRCPGSISSPLARSGLAIDTLSARLLEGTEGGYKLVIIILEEPVGA